MKFAPILRVPNSKLPLQVYTNALDRKIYGCWYEMISLTLKSKKLNRVKQRYYTYKKEMIAVVCYLSVWKVYLLEHKFTIKMDNEINTLKKTLKKLSQQHAQLQEFLAKKDFIQEHKPGDSTELWMLQVGGKLLLLYLLLYKWNLKS